MVLKEYLKKVVQIKAGKYIELIQPKNSVFIQGQIPSAIAWEGIISNPAKVLSGSR